jgi:SPX domain protein involved in polyphosphate accumulation
VDSQQRIERREYKYLMAEALIPPLRQAIAPYCRLDANAAEQPSHQYPIESLYFDTTTLALFRANQRTQVDRFKLRARHYPSVSDGPVFLEVKRRCNDVIHKTRGIVPRQGWAELLGEPAGLSRFGGSNRSALERFLFLLGTHDARPVMLVSYRREAWVSQVDDYARVTFDRQICSQPHESLSFEPDTLGWRHMDHPAIQRTSASMTVVELKFTSTVPRWMMSLVQRFDLLRQSFSKYGTSIETWHLAQPLRLTPRAHGVAA